VAQESRDMMSRNSVFIWIGLATLAVLLIPLVAMQFTNEVHWEPADFIVMGSLLFGMASLFVLAARKTFHKYRIFVGVVFTAIFFYVWAELAVGLFTGLGR
jgi:uncharacterized BrkB/YihY/UPF0761 family membrane protein